MMGGDVRQMTLDLFAADKPPKLTPLDSFLQWAHGMHHCGCEIDAIASRLFDRMPDAFDRGKALVTACRVGVFDPLVVGALGLFDASLDYHVCWDRAHAARCGIPRERVGEVHSCDHDNRGPGFYGIDGELVWRAER